MIVGGGPAGAATAIALARGGASVVLLNRTNGKTVTAGESLPSSAGRLLHNLGIWDAFLSTDPQPCYANRSAWGGDGRVVERDAVANPHGHGWQIDRPRFEAMLLRGAGAAGVCLREDTRIVEERIGRDGRWCLVLNGPLGRERAVSPIVVDASGRAASFARRHDAQRRRIDRLIASSACLEPSASAPPCESVTLVEAVEHGWWYSAPQPDGRLAVTYFTDAGTVSARMARTGDSWWNLMSQTGPTRERIERHHARLIGPPRGVAAGSGLLDRITGDRWLAVGDAAATHDPLSSHGIGAALRGGQRAADAILAFLAGDALALRRYAMQIVESYAQYLWIWSAYYAEERRWPEAPFWRRRHRFAAVAPPLVTHPRRPHSAEPMRGQSPAAAISTGIDLPA